MSASNQWGRFTRLKACISVVSLCLVSLSASAENSDVYPTKPIKLIVPFSPGSVTDALIRTVGHAAAKKLGQPIVIENRAGATGTLGPIALMNVPSDGYTLSAITASAIMVAHQRQLSYDPIADLTYIIGISAFNFALVVPRDGPHTSLDSFVENARKHPEILTYATPGVGGGAHLSMEQLQLCKSIKLNHIPYKGAADATTAFYGGLLDAQADGSWANLVDSGKGRLLLMLTSRRTPYFPEVPTLSEVCPQAAADTQQLGIAGPKGIDPAIVDKIHNAFKSSLDDPAFLAALKSAKQNVNYLSSSDYAEWALNEFQSKGSLIKSLGLNKPN